jgi:hypothetical protein
MNLTTVRQRILFPGLSANQKIRRSELLLTHSQSMDCRQEWPAALGERIGDLSRPEKRKTASFRIADQVVVTRERPNNFQ